MSDVPDRPTGPDDEGDDPFAGLPPELRAMLEQLGGPDALQQAQEQLSQLLGGMQTGGQVPGFGFTPPAAPEGPVDWQLASRVALQLAAEDDRQPTPEERTRVANAFELAEHWLDATPLPAPPDAGRVVVGSRQTWVNAAIPALRPLVEPVARASTDAMVDMAREQLEALSEEGGMPDLGELLPGMEQMPPGFAQLFEQMMGQDPGQMMRPAGAALAGLQAGQVIGQLARQLYGQYDLGIPTAPREEAYHLIVNVADDLDGYDLDATEVAVVMALTEAAHRRLYHAVPWLEAHVASLVARFASGTVVDGDRLRQVTEELTLGIDPEDPESLQSAMERAAGFQLQPTEEQQRVLSRLQSVVCLVGAWARHEVARAIEGRLPSYERISEVLRRQRVVKGDGEELLTALLGLDLMPEDESVGEAFVATVEAALGPAGLHRALAHPENLPDADELADPGSWLARTSDDPDVPDDAAALFGELTDAPREGSYDERVSERDAEETEQGDGEADDEDGSGGGGSPAGS